MSSPSAPEAPQPDGPTPTDDSRWAIEALLARGQLVWFTAHGNSMRPLIVPGTRLCVRPVRAAELRVGDVALCRAGERLLLHRVWSVGPGALTLCGDNQRTLQHVEPGQVLGRLDAHVGSRPVLDAYDAFRRLGARRLTAARWLNRGYRVFVRATGPARRIRGWLRGA